MTAPFRDEAGRYRAAKLEDFYGESVNETVPAAKEGIVADKPKLGSGERFGALAQKLKKQGARDPKALAAWIGRKKYGSRKMASMAAKGR